jgi:hypothetical protein
VKFYEAAIKVLMSAQQPLTTRQITDLALERRLIKPRTKTPLASMARALYSQGRNDPRLVKLEDRGTLRAKRDSVRWTLRQDSNSDLL